MRRTSPAGAWGGCKVYICDTATVAGGRLHPHAGKRGEVLHVRPAGGQYSVRLEGGELINASSAVLVLEGAQQRDKPIGAWPTGHGSAAAPSVPPTHIPLTNSTSRQPLPAGALQPLLRDDAADADRWPSRRGNRLHYRSGRVTDLQGNPLEQ